MIDGSRMRLLRGQEVGTIQARCDDVAFIRVQGDTILSDQLVQILLAEFRKWLYSTSICRRNLLDIIKFNDLLVF